MPGYFGFISEQYRRETNAARVERGLPPLERIPWERSITLPVGGKKLKLTCGQRRN